MELRVFFFTIIFHAFLFSKAQTCCSGGIPLSNNIGLAITEKGTTQIGIHYDYNNLNTLNNGSEKLDDNSRLRITHSVLINIGYSITNSLAVEGLLTWVNQRRNISQFGNEDLTVTSGIGDAVILLKYNFPNILFGANSDISLGIGPKIPLGSSTETNNQGITLNADLQPGSNAWDIIYWSQISKRFNFRPSLTVSSRFIYRDTGTNTSYFGDSTYKFGEELQVFLSFSDQYLLFNTLSNPSISFKYRKAKKDKTGGGEVFSTGGNWISIIPNFSINLKPNIAFSTKVELPIYSDVSGTQLTPTYRITSGVLININKKENVLNLN